MSTRPALLKGYAAFAAMCLAPGLSIAQTYPLTYRPLAAEYSSALDRIIMVSTGPDQLHIYDAAFQTDVPINLPKPPYSVSVSPDGLHAAVGHDALISYVNLVSQTVEKILPVPVVAQSVVLSASWIYTLPTYEGNSISVNIATGLVTPNNSVFMGVVAG